MAAKSKESYTMQEQGILKQACEHAFSGIIFPSSERLCRRGTFDYFAQLIKDNQSPVSNMFMIIL